MRLRRCSMMEFAHQIDDKKVVCYGIGNEFDLIIRCYSEYEWVKKIGYLVDNNPKKVGNTIRINDVEYSIINLQSFTDLGDKDVVILPTCAAFVSIIDELNDCSWFDEIDCYVFHCMFNMSDGVIQSIRQTHKMLIPPVIHYCWYGRQPLPDKYREYIDGWKRMCPDYEVIEWNEDNTDVNETHYTSEAYEAGKYGFVSDYFRLKAVYEYGGIYFDTDVELVKNLDDLRYNDAFCGIEFPGRIALGLGFGARKHNHIVRRIMDYYDDVHFLRPDGTYDETTCPEIHSRILFESGLKYGMGNQLFEGMFIYPIEVLSPKNPYTWELRITENTYAIHQFDGTWASESAISEGQKKVENARRILGMIE